MDSRSLSDVINEAIQELDPGVQDNQVEEQDEDLVDLDDAGDPDTEEYEEESEDESEDDESEDVEDEDSEEEGESEDGEKFVVKVDGEELEVTLDELKAGYSRQAHFTRKMQELKEEREAYEAELEQVSGTLTQIEQLDQAWSENPVTVLTHLISSTDNPAQSLGYLIREMAVYDLLPPEALEYFGIDQNSKEAWAQESELERLRREASELQELQEKSSADARVQEAMRGLELQIREIVVDEGLQFETDTDEARFRAELLGYAKDTGITDLKKAYAAMSYERSKAQRGKAPKSNPRKEATRVVSKRGAGAGGVTPVRNGKQELRSVIETTMKEMNLL
jgi:hypothetical protein